MFEPVPDLPGLVAAIRARPDDEAGWLALAAHFRDNRRDDPAAAVRVFWPALRNRLGGRALESVLADVQEHSKVIGTTVREIEAREFDGSVQPRRSRRPRPCAGCEPVNVRRP